MNRITLATLALLVMGAGATASTVDIEALGALELIFERAVPLETYPAQPVSARVAFRKGEAFNIPSPGRVQQIEYLVQPGAMVVENQPFAVLRGPEMHHFEMRYQGAQALAAGAERRFNSNKALYERRAISESRWLDISSSYYALMLEYEHMRHFFELVVSGDDDPDALTLAAPLAGLIDYYPAGTGVEEGDSIARFLPPAAVRLEVSLPHAISAAVTSVRAAECLLDIERVSAVTDGFFVQAWTQALPPNCSLMLGQQLLGTPMVRAGSAYRVPRSAVFQLEGESHVLVRSGSGESLAAVAVTLLGADGEGYLLRAASSLEQAEVLVTSVSAVQGILLGLGGE